MTQTPQTSQGIYAADRVAMLTAENPQWRGEQKPRLLVVGAGMMGREHLRVTQLLGWADVQGIVDPFPDSVSQALAEWRSITDQPLMVYPDAREASLDTAVDAIVICTPNYTHFDVLQSVCISEKPILLEKPMATNLLDAARLVTMEKKYPTFIQLGMQYRYKAQYVDALCELQSRATLGAVKTVAMSEYRPPFLDKVDQWNKFNCNSGGTLVEKCCHYFDLINLVAQSQPKRVYASGGRAVNFLDFEWRGKMSDIDDHAMVIIDYDNGVHANFTLNMFCQELYEELVVVGERGRLVASERASFRPDIPSSAQLQVEVPQHPAYRGVPVGYPDWIEASGHYGATFFEHIAFNLQLAGQAVDAATPEQALWSLIVASAAQHSMQTGREVDVGAFCEAEGIGDFYGGR
ncbi:MAG: Gfo/Idh/MocA family oxidoreductase [Halieaceae bacterium]